LFYRQVGKINAPVVCLRHVSTLEAIAYISKFESIMYLQLFGRGSGDFDPAKEHPCLPNRSRWSRAGRRAAEQHDVSKLA
jgi:hypothetical protein